MDGDEVIAVQCAKNLTLGNDTEEDIDVTCLDDAEDNFDPGKPYNILPFKKFEAKKKDIDIFGKEESPQYGKVSKN